MAVTAEQVLKAMQDAGKPVRPGDVAKALDADSKEVSKAIDELKKSGKIMSPKRCYSGRVALPVNNFSLPPPEGRLRGLLALWKTRI